MPLPITIPNTFANATATIPLSQLDSNFSTVEVAVNSIGNGAFTLANAQITGGTISNVTLDNVSVDVETLSNVTITNLTVDGNATFTNAAVTANVATITTANVTTANVTNLVTGNATITGGTINVASVIATDDVTVGDDLVFTGTGNRITGDFSNATIANRVMFQTSTTNGATLVDAFPNGTSTEARFRLSNNSDPANSATMQLVALSSEASLRTAATGTGTLLPMTFHTGGSERMRIDTSGNVGIGTSSPATILNAYSATNASFNLDGDSTVAMRASRYSTDTSQSAFQFRKARGTLALPTAVASGDATGAISFQAYGGSNFRTTASVQSLVETYTSDTNIAGYLVFSTNGGSTSATERMRIDSSGNVGIGTSSPNSKLEISGSTTFIPTTTITADNAVTGWRVRRTGGIYPREYYIGIRENSAALDFYDNTADALRARIDSSGNLLVGTTTADARLVGSTLSTTQRSIHAGSVSGSTTTDGVYYGYVNQARGTGFNFMSFQNTSAVDFKILGNGNVQNTNNSYGAISDVKLKENIVDATPKLEKIQQVRVVNYNFKGAEQKQLGVIAQELEEIFPGMVEETPDRDGDGNFTGKTTKSVKYSVFVPMLIKAIQEQQQMIETLQAKVAALENA